MSGTAKHAPTLRVARILYPVTTLGYGNRIGIWLQGCSICCPGCISEDLWPSEGGRLMKIMEFLQKCGSWLERCDGITITGGEPLEQERGTKSLCQQFRKVNSGDIVLFTGFTYDVVHQKSAWIRDGIVDVLISGPYNALAGHKKMLRGSDNQNIHLLTDLGHARYPSDIQERQWNMHRRLDWFQVGNIDYFAGIPEPDWGLELEKGIHNRGFSLESINHAKYGETDEPG